MLDATRGDLSSMPLGIRSDQNAIGSPNTFTPSPASWRYAAADKPYGPAPMTATWQSVDGPLSFRDTFGILFVRSRPGKGRSIGLGIARP